MGVYEGSEPYLFISYSHKDQTEMEEVRDFLDRNNFRYWYDRALQSGGVWGAELAKKLKASHSLLLLLSPNSAASNNVKNEITYAANYNKDVHIVMMENFTIPDELELALVRYHRIMKNGREYENILLRSLPEELVGKAGQNSRGSKPSEDTVTDPKKLTELAGKHLDRKDGYRNNPANAGELYHEVNDQGIVLTERICYEETREIHQHFAKAVKLYFIGAKQGDAEAQNNLGNCYYNGRGVNRDYAEAVKWYRKAADQGNAAAQCNLGVCYYNGDGVKQDYTEAVNWYRKAAEQGNAEAQNNLGNCYYNGFGVNQDYAEAVNWYRKAANQGDEDACMALFECYTFGRGVPKDCKAADYWFDKATSSL